MSSLSVSRRWGGTFDPDGLRRAIDGLNDRTQREGFWDDNDAAGRVLAERAKLEQALNAYERLAQELRDAAELVDLVADDGDDGMLDELSGQLPDIERRLREMELTRMLSEPHDRGDAIVSINPGAGGIDAQDWAEMLMRMYLRWCEHRGFKTTIVNQQPGDDAGIKDVSFTVEGPYAYGFLRAENGVHRLIRISPFDANARRHTGFAAVFVVPDLGEESDEVVIKPEDLRVDTFRASGAGGQHVNRTESAIRLTHIPTGIVVSCQAERSQHKNRSTAMKMLAGRLYEKQRQEREAEFAANHQSKQLAIAFGSQVRTYTLQPYTLVKDERTDYKSSDAQGVLDGDLDGFIEAYLMKAASERSKQSETH